MKLWIKETVLPYFSFSKKERIGIILALTIIVGAYILVPMLLQPAPRPDNSEMLIKEIAQLKISIDSSAPKYNRYNNNDDEYVSYYEPAKNDRGGRRLEGEVFPFDPNTIDRSGWLKLGVREKTVNTIEKLLSKGFKFKQPGDLKKVFGFYPPLAERLIPYVRIEASAGKPPVITSEELKPSAAPRKSTTIAIDINTADTSQFKQLKGISSKLAARIITFRNKLGGFTSVAQLGQTYGLPDSTFQQIKPQLLCNTNGVQTININTADANQLKAHPYINYNLANAIVQYRKQHGNYNVVADIKRIELVTDDVFEKVSPYLQANP